LPTEGIEIVQRQEYDESGRRLTRIALSIEVPPDFPAKYQRVLIRAADLCSVKRAIADPPEFDISVTDS